jgi:hypothetical protein
MNLYQQRAPCRRLCFSLDSATHHAMTLTLSYASSRQNSRRSTAEFSRPSMRVVTTATRCNCAEPARSQTDVSDGFALRVDRRRQKFVAGASLRSKPAAAAAESPSGRSRITTGSRRTPLKKTTSLSANTLTAQAAPPTLFRHGPPTRAGNCDSGTDGKRVIPLHAAGQSAPVRKRRVV